MLPDEIPAAIRARLNEVGLVLERRSEAGGRVSLWVRISDPARGPDRGIAISASGKDIEEAWTSLAKRVEAAHG